MRYLLINIAIRTKRLFHWVFGKLLFKIEVRQRLKINSNINEYMPVDKFRELEALLQAEHVNFPNNEFNKIMSMILQDLEQFQYITKQYRISRKQLKVLTTEENIFRSLDKNARSFPVHPLESSIREAIAVDVKCLFLFGSVVVDRSLLLLSMYLPSGEGNPPAGSFQKLFNLYQWLETEKLLSPISTKFKERFLIKIKWLNSAMRFYRNNFIEHIKRGYQQGSNYSVHGGDFSLYLYKWDYNETDDERIEQFRSEMENRGVSIPGRTGHRSLVNRYYIQQVFDNITQVPYNLMKKALNITEDIGVNSPQPEKLISELEGYFNNLFAFMIQEIDSSNLI
jgi:hypothetical protein